MRVSLKNIILTLALPLIIGLAVSFTSPDRSSTPQVIYVEKYAALAIDEMYRSGVPASITLAQGLLESRYGLSELATKGNNHFGIKCHNNWQGGKVYHDDDAKGECFRKYDSPEESFRDHSDFLRYRDRYKFLFDLEPTDYKGWAYGLKQAGYATDVAYPEKLIRLIEEYSLHEYDVKPSATAEPESSSEMKEDKKEERKKKKAASKAARKEKTLPQSPNQIERVTLFTGPGREIFRFNLSRQMYSHNGVPFVYSAEGETYQSIAESYDLFLREILRYNDLTEAEELAPGTVVYVQAKKNRALGGLEMHVVDVDGETLRDISQRYAVKLDKLCRMNGFGNERYLRSGDVVVLR